MNKLFSIASLPGGDSIQSALSADSTRVGAATGQVASSLRNRILEGFYTFEERLPAERHLAEEFKVSRGTMRSALDLLEKQGLVVRKIGSGTFVSYRPVDDLEDITRLTSPVEMVEVRLAFEPQMVRLAIANASSHDLEALHEALLWCENCGGDAEAFARADNAFHNTLALCTKNKLMYWLFERISQVRSNSQWQVMKNHLLTQQKIDDYNQQHRALYEAIIARNTPLAVKIIKSHLHGVHSDVNQTMEMEEEGLAL